MDQELLMCDHHLLLYSSEISISKISVAISTVLLDTELYIQVAQWYYKVLIDQLLNSHSIIHGDNKEE